MKLRIDGIYQCKHPRVEVEAGEVKCLDCPYAPRPSQLSLDTIQRLTTEVSTFQLYVERASDQFMSLEVENAYNH